MAPKHQESSETPSLTAFQAEPDQARQWNSDRLNLSVFDDHTHLLQEEFCRFLEKSGFVEGVIDFYINNERRLVTETTSYTDSYHPCGRRNTGEWQQLVRKSLSPWLFWLTYITTAQAKFVDEDRPMSRAQLAALFSDRLFHQNRDDLFFRAHRKRFWTPALLRNTVHEALKDINLPSRVTLENLAMCINFRSQKVSSPIKLVTPLSGKHLQKLLRQNDIKWIEIKRRYVERLLVERKARR